MGSVVDPLVGGSGLVVAGGTGVTVGLGPGKDDEACIEVVETGRVVVVEFEEAVGESEGEPLGEAVWDVVEELGVMVETGRVVVVEFEEAVGESEGEPLGEAVWDVVEELGVMDEFEGTGRDEVGLTDEVGTEVFFVEEGTTIIVEFAVDGSETASVTLA